MEDLSRFFTVIGAVFAAAKGITDQFKARWPWLGEPLDNPQAEKKRELRVIIFNATVAAILAGLASIDVFALLGLNAFAGLKASFPALYLIINMVAVGLMSTFGSPFLHEILSILIEFKENIRLHNQQATLQLLPVKKREPVVREK
ncbi:hypothetical protein [Moorella sp. Hama-1]|uniref:hypothetical protein n=1 Tax=Moorella sp. Hama-1 TaxID=2138101 RepID=UPI000D658632|nr:hypothetical protein [Moorella sp. Hama-1]BCV21293.1 hypothetical protein hamaS1_13620 [Moorella sp. Hama-1]